MIKKVELTTRAGKKVIGRRVAITSDFHSSIDKVWDKIQDIDTLREICKPKASFISCNSSPMQWKEGNSFVFKMEEIGNHITRYTDVVDLYASSLTSLVAWWTLKFYKHRQRKWQKIAKSL